MNIRITALLIALVLTSTLVSPRAYAQDDQIVGGGNNGCLAVYPCDENGELLALLDDESSPCYDYFAAQCYKAKRDLLKSCEAAKKRIQRQRSSKRKNK